MDNGKRGQVAIFIIVAIVIVGILLAVFVIPGRLRIGAAEDPSAFLKSCLDDEIDNVIQTISNQGGEYRPDNFLLYKNEKIQYLCYTTEDFKPCKVQQPLLLRHFELEMKEQIEPKARACMNDLIDTYTSKGYSVSNAQNLGEINVSIVTDKIFVDFLAPITISKEGSQTFRKFSVRKDSQMYDLLLTATSIIDFESTLGNAETSLYIRYYPDLKIEKIERDEGDTIYIITNVVSKESFTFASRSLVWPQGYGVT